MAPPQRLQSAGSSAPLSVPSTRARRVQPISTAKTTVLGHTNSSSSEEDGVKDGSEDGSRDEKDGSGDEKVGSGDEKVGEDKGVEVNVEKEKREAEEDEEEEEEEEGRGQRPVTPDHGAFLFIILLYYTLMILN